MNDYLVTLAAGALAGILSRPNGGHGVEPRSLEDLGREAAQAARATLAELEEHATAPEPKRKR